MFTKPHNITYTFFDVGGGDAIWIRFFGTDQNWHNILIDGGYGYAYKQAFGPLLYQLVTAGEKIDLWIISHIDRDHIGAILGFMQDKKIKNKILAIKEFWFNHSEQIVDIPDGKLAVGDGIKFRNYLIDNGLLTRETITTSLPAADFFGLKLTILSPTQEKQEIASKLWDAEEKISKLGRSVSDADHYKTIEELQDIIFTSDDDPVNGSSIALLTEYKGLNAVLLADSHPADIVNSLSSLGYSNEKPLKAVFMQLAHHGSKANTSPALLKIINTNDFVITGNGIHNRHPDKETLVRLLVQENRNETPLHFYFVCDTKELSNMFAADHHPFEHYNFTCTYGGKNKNGLSFPYLPLND